MKNPIMRPVLSTLASHIGYNPDTQTLHVRHHDGSEYTYAAVPSIKHDELMRAKSTGSYLHQHIRGKHRHSQTK